jgi:hypothetical protein
MSHTCHAGTFEKGWHIGECRKATCCCMAYTETRREREEIGGGGE